MKPTTVSASIDEDKLLSKYQKKMWDATNYIYWSITSILIGLFIVEFFIFSSLWKSTFLFKLVLIFIGFVSHTLVKRNQKLFQILCLSYLILFSAYCFTIINIESGPVVTFYFLLLTLLVTGANYFALWETLYSFVEVFLISALFLVIIGIDDYLVFSEKMTLGGYAFFSFMYLSAFVPNARKKNYLLYLERDEKKQAVLNELVSQYNNISLKLNELEQSQKIDKDREKLLRHDLKNKIHNIIGLAQIIDGENLNDEEKSYMALLKDVSNDLLKYADSIYKKNEDKFDNPLTIILESVNPVSVISKALIGVQNKAKEKNILLKAEKITKDDFIMADFLILSNVLQNMLNYMIIWSENNSEIIISSGSNENNTYIEIFGPSANISAKSLNAMFKPLESFQFNSSFEAPKGLGLQIAKNMVDKMSGYFKYRTELNGGVVFIIEFKTLKK